jgi:hypothetical protein
MLLAYVSGGARALDNVFYIARDLGALEPFQVVVGDQHEFDWKAWSIPRSLLRKIYHHRKSVPQFSDRGMDQASIINFLSSEDTPELAPGFFIFS